ncbi:putative lipase rog1 [Phtheirospermum japonicum]|uniref:Putative lipase rog1 n=1 Tax=Phtheirospermum japonicum TaxID=374723 RepID=A0A830C4Y7_9LAMI|nr:putative lipase rog1 [Phtheirospermum japonicum]
MGERLADEVLQVIKRKPSLKKFSFVALSVGGLVARYAIGKLYKPPSRGCNDESKGTIADLQPINFITVATPHLGSRGNKQVKSRVFIVPFLFGVTALIHWIIRRTGQHLFLTDNDDEASTP